MNHTRIIVYAKHYNLSLEPGIYVIEVDARWKENGGASYGFLLKVNPPQPEVTTLATSEVTITEVTPPDNKTLLENKTDQKSIPAFETANAMFFIAIIFFLMHK